VCLYVYECALLKRWVYFLCYFSCISFFLPIYKFDPEPDPHYRFFCEHGAWWSHKSQGDQKSVILSLSVTIVI